MPRKTREEYLAEEEVEEAPGHVEIATGDFAEEEPHIKCPCCGLMARIEPDTKRRKESRNRIPSLKEGPYHPIYRLQRYGGSEEKQTFDPREKRQGKMVWEDPRELTLEERELLIHNLRGALEALEGTPTREPMTKKLRAGKIKEG